VQLTGGRTKLTRAETEAGCRAILAAFGATGALLVVPGRSRVGRFGSPGTSASWAALNRDLARLAAETARAVYVDTVEVLRCWDHYLADRVHYTEEGHAALAEALAAVIRPRLAAALPVAEAS
jgi:lysophospholipase L1-like esterase